MDRQLATNKSGCLSTDWCLILKMLLIVYLGGLSMLIVWAPGTLDRGVAYVQAESDSWLLHWGAYLVAVTVRDVLIFLPLGFLLSAALPGKRSSILGLPLAVLQGFVATLVVGGVLRTYWIGLPFRAPPLPALLLIISCGVVGCWYGVTFARSRSLWRWVCAQGLLTLVAVTLVTVGLAWFGLATMPLDIEAEPVSSEDRRRLVNLLRAHDPRDIAPGSVGRLTLTERDINQLFSESLALNSERHKARADINSDQVTLWSSLWLPPIGAFKRYLNLMVSGTAMVKQGIIEILPSSVQVGQIKAPPWLMAMSGAIVINQSWQNQYSSFFLSSLKNIQLADSSVQLTYTHLDVPEGFIREALIGLSGMPDMAPSTSVYVNRLIEHIRRSATTPSLAVCISVVFEAARQRSVGADPIQENRAALLALGYLIGHRGVDTLVGKLPTWPRSVDRRLRKVLLRGRRDWARHYTVSAALEVLSNVAASNAAGLLKEELDAVDGGSGFSFADLMADRAGTQLGKIATANRQSARRLQERLHSGLDVDDFFPPADDLPEGLTDAELQRQYGGVGGARYEALVAEIDRRLEMLAMMGNRVTND